jgi:hypothetical protein
MFHVFVCNWWTRDPNDRNKRVPGAGPKRTLARNVATIEEARAIARQYNEKHEPGFLSRKAEFEEQ